MEAYRPIPLYGAGAEKEQATHKGNECVMSGGRHFSGCSRSDGAARAVRAAACRRGCMGAGIIGLWQSRARKKNPFDRAAKILLEGKDKSSAEQAASVSFSEEGMTVPAGGGKAEFVPYREFECAVETADSFLFVLWRPCPAVAENGLKSGMYRRFLQSDLGKSETVSLDCVKGRRQGKPMRLPSERKNAPASFKMR